MRFQISKRNSRYKGLFLLLVILTVFTTSSARISAASSKSTLSERQDKVFTVLLMENESQESIHVSSKDSCPSYSDALVGQSLLLLPENFNALSINSYSRSYFYVVLSNHAP